MRMGPYWVNKINLVFSCFNTKNGNPLIQKFLAFFFLFFLFILYYIYAAQ